MQSGPAADDNRIKIETPLWTWAVLGLVCLAAALVRLHLLDVPFERDEGEYAYAGQLILQGVPPFAQVYNMKLPGIYAAYALIMSVFGETIIGVRLGLLLINALTTLFFFLAFRRRVGSTAALWGGAFLAVISLNPSVQGFMANAEHFVLVFAAAGLWMLLRGLDSRSGSTLFLSGLLFGTAYLMKQHGVFFILFGLIYLIYSRYRQTPSDWAGLFRAVFSFSAGVFLPFILACLILWQAGVFDRFWFWTFTYAREYVSSESISKGFYRLWLRSRSMFSDFPLVLILAAIGWLVTIRDKQARKNIFFVFSFLAASFLAVTPGLYFRPHYMIFTLPALGLSAGIGLEGIRRRYLPHLSPRIGTPVLFGIFLIASAFQFAAEYRLFFYLNPTQISHQLYYNGPFPESLDIAAFIRENSRAGDKIAVLGSEPQIYFYARRRAATGYMYTYPMMEPQPFALSMQRDMIAQIEAARPEYIVYIGVPALWPLPKMKPLYDWGWRYIPAYYRRVGLIDGLGPEPGPGGGVKLWGEEAARAGPKSPDWIGVYRRK